MTLPFLYNKYNRSKMTRDENYFKKKKTNLRTNNNTTGLQNEENSDFTWHLYDIIYRPHNL